MPIWDAGITGASFISCATTPAPIRFLVNFLPFCLKFILYYFIVSKHKKYKLMVLFFVHKMTVSLYYSVKRFIIYLKDRVAERKGQRFLYLLFYSPNVHNSCCWARLKPKARSQELGPLVWFSTWLTVLEPSSDAFQHIHRKLDRNCTDVECE